MRRKWCLLKRVLYKVEKLLNKAKKGIINPKGSRDSYDPEEP